MRLSFIGLALLASIVAQNAKAQQREESQNETIACKMDEGPYHGPFIRGFCSTSYCGNDPESWVRGAASINKKSGRVDLTLELETDSVAAGPKGLAIAHMKDSTGKDVATFTSNEKGIGGKKPGPSFIQMFSANQSIPINLAQKVESVEIETRCTGKQGGFFGTSISVLAISHTFPLPH